jgi:predicted NUDIX family phosphoesterase
LAVKTIERGASKMEDLVRVLQETTDINEVADIRDSFSYKSSLWEEADRRLRELLKAKYKDEEVLVVDANTATDLANPGLNYIDEDDVLEINKRLADAAEFKPRYEVEFNPMYKQVIPYIIVLNEDETKVFAMTRIKGDSRLVGNISIGVGGHINPIDATEVECADCKEEATIIDRGLLRELNEELLIEGRKGKLRSFAIHPAEALLYDNSNKVGQDHIGLICRCIVDEEIVTVEVKEKDTLSGEMRDIKELEKDIDKMENWTRIVYEKMLNIKIW